MRKSLYSTRGIYVILDILPHKSRSDMDMKATVDVRTASEKNDRLPMWNAHSRGDLIFSGPSFQRASRPRQRANRRSQDSK